VTPHGPSITPPHPRRVALLTLGLGCALSWSASTARAAPTGAAGEVTPGVVNAALDVTTDFTRSIQVGERARWVFTALGMVFVGGKALEVYMRARAERLKQDEGGNYGRWQDAEKRIKKQADEFQQDVDRLRAVHASELQAVTGRIDSTRKEWEQRLADERAEVARLREEIAAMRGGS
jgi:hypothetical protein